MTAKHRTITDALQSASGVEHLKDILSSAGIPLEVKTAAICEKFATETRERLGKRGFPSASRVVYGDPKEDSAMRELDQVVRFYDEVQLANGLYGITPHLEVLIECKHRANLAYFGIALEPRQVPLSAFPLLGDFAGSILCDKYLRPEPAEIFQLADQSVVLVETDKKGTPTKVSDEQLIYKASGALYDYIKATYDSGSNYLVHHFRETGLEKRLRLEERYLVFWNEWLKEYSKQDYAKMNGACFGGEGVMHLGMAQYIPVICVDGAIFTTRLTKDGELEDPRPAKWLATSTRLPHWPGKWRPELVRHAPEARVILCDVGHLEELLKILNNWHSTVVQNLKDCPDELARKAPLEAAVRRAVVEQTLREQTRYTSEFDSLSFD